MPFRFDPAPRFACKVRVGLPGAEPQELDTRFRALPTEQLDAFDLSTREGADAFLEAVVEGFDDVVDAEGAPIEDPKPALLAIDWIRQPVTRAYFEALAGARRGN
jgi:hypothetical protein